MMEDNKVFFASGEDQIMIDAFAKAQETFKYFWRELYWESRRIIPALDMASVKVAFTQEFEDDKGETYVEVEHMWIGDIYFDGMYIYGELLNEPNILTNIEEGESIGVTVDQISDWMFLTEGKSYGGFTVQAMRSQMSEEELKEHDTAWGLDFGDFNNILVAYNQEEHPENLIEHPMSKNMKESLIEFLDKNPEEITLVDPDGFTFLHREAIAGNLSTIEILLAKGADKHIKSEDGKTALEYAQYLKWDHIIPVLS
ncbi:DUF2314 domain-containing protein [Myroides sp. BIT-d1]|uniref:DUF2314 domain-containing protein n=2 Tax=Myroides albus TaxID=2562892 RepID=A0A6I3LKJ5_9FLAO|nr:DUF2314 domain-containing protein [Myroides albus]